MVAADLEDPPTPRYPQKRERHRGVISPLAGISISGRNSVTRSIPKKKPPRPTWCPACGVGKGTPPFICRACGVGIPRGVLTWSLKASKEVK